MIIAFIHLFGLIIFPNLIGDIYDQISPNVVGRISTIFWLILLFLLILEFMNLLLVNNKTGILSEDAISDFCKIEIDKSNSIILIPAYNEEKTISNAISIASSAGKVLVINDGSSDRTEKISLQEADFVISHRKNLGLAQTISDGVEFGLSKNFTQFAIFDADCQYNKENLIQIVKILQNSHYDLILGSRLQGIIEEMKFSKYVGNWIFSKAISYIIQRPISDGQTGLRAFSNIFASSIKFRGSFTYTQEMLFEAAKNNLLITEIPIEFTRRISGESRLMTGPINYAIRAWILNIQILAEYNPLKFGITIAGGLLSISFLALNDNSNDISTIAMVILLCIFMIVIEIALFAGILIRKMDKLDSKRTFIVLKELQDLD